jgi:hypothetical protein
VSRAKRSCGCSPAAPCSEHASFYAGFKPIVRESKSKPLDKGDRVSIEGDHPHSGREGVIAGVTHFKYGIGGGVGVEIRFDDGDGCFVFPPCKLRRVEVRPNNAA